MAVGEPTRSVLATTRILLVEGDEDEAAKLAPILRQQSGWQVTVARGVLDAIRAAGDASFDAAILDYEQPDGTGLDLLDFLRLGSPDIKILILSEPVPEEIALHALSHGARDFLVKDNHIEQELPRRIEALIDHVTPTSAFIETLRPSDHVLVRPDMGESDDEREPIASAPGRAPLRADPRSGPLHDAVAALIGPPTFAAAVYDAHGRPLAEELVEPLEGAGVGFGLASIHAQVGALWATTALKPTSYLALVHVEGGLLGLTAVPGPLLVALLMDQSTNHAKAVKTLMDAARVVAKAASDAAKE